MKYRVDFKNNQPAHATLISATVSVGQRAEFDIQEGKTIIKHLYLEADNPESAINQAKKILDRIFQF